MAASPRPFVFDVVADDPDLGVKAGDTVSFDPATGTACRACTLAGAGVLPALFRGALVPVTPADPRPALTLCPSAGAAPVAPSGGRARRRRASQPPALSIVRGGLARTSRPRT